jgi:hypothetical protein
MREEIIMAEILLRVFDSFDTAQQARSALIDAGVEPSAVLMRPLEDDGGPLQDNCRADTAQKPARAAGAPNRQSAQSASHAPEKRACCLLEVEVADPQQRAVAEQVLLRLARGDRPERPDSGGAPRQQ